MGDDVVSVAPSRGVSDISGVELGSVMSSEPQVYVELSIFEGRGQCNRTFSYLL